MNTATRNEDLRQILIERRRELHDDVQNRIRGGRKDQRNDIELALLQMRAETLTRISEALVRLEAGEYGTCLSCGGDITKRRLRALPFAVRCQGCEEKREFAQQDRSRHLALTRDDTSLFPDMTSWQ